MRESITLHVPEELATRARQIAATLAQPVEQLLLDHLKTLSVPLPVLPHETQAELDALQQLSDDALWTIAGAQMPAEVQARAKTLLDNNSRGVITDEEHDELETLVERGDRLMLCKAEAVAILRGRRIASPQTHAARGKPMKVTQSSALRVAAATATLVQEILALYPKARIVPRLIPFEDEDISLDVQLPLEMADIYKARERIHALVIPLQEQYDVVILASAVPAEPSFEHGTTRQTTDGAS